MGSWVVYCLFAQNYTITEKSELKDIVNSLKACRLPCKDQQKWQNENYIDLFPSDHNLPIEQQFFYFAKERVRVFQELKFWVKPQQWWEPELSLWDFIVHLHHSKIPHQSGHEPKRRSDRWNNWECLLALELGFTVPILAGRLRPARGRPAQLRARSPPPW